MDEKERPFAEVWQDEVAIERGVIYFGLVVDGHFLFGDVDEKELRRIAEEINTSFASRVKAAVESEREAAIKACDNEFVDDEDGLNKEDVAYNAGVRDCINAIKSTAERRGK